MHIALYTHDQSLASELRPSLHESGFGSSVIAEPSAIPVVAAGQDVLILDLKATGDELETVLSNARSGAPDIAILGITAGNSADERISALRAGLDDCVSRSFSPLEIALRVQSLVRRAAGRGETVLKFADILLDRVARTVTRGGQPLHLTDREYRTLEYFIRNAGRVISPMELCEQVWQFHFDPCSNVVQVFIMRLRKKIDDGFPQKVVHTVPRGGYVLRRESDMTPPVQASRSELAGVAA